jgi:glycosyltransferase involved in cell wall biosynthesis
MDFPRVLVMSRIKFNQQGGAGAVMGSLFRGWPPNAIAQIHTEQFTEADTSICANYLRLPGSAIQRPLLRPRAMASLIKASLYFAVGRRATLGYWVHMKDVLDWARQFSPDVIYTVPIADRPFFYFRLPQRLARILGIPYVVHMWDDWPARYEYENRRGLMNRLFWRPLLRRSLQSLLDDATVNIGISEEMCEAYRERYRRLFVPFHSCIDVSEWARVEKSYHKSGEFRIVHVGSVSERKNLDALIDIRDAVLSLKQNGYPIRFVLYSSPLHREYIQERLDCPPGVVYGGYVDRDRFPQELGEADLLVLAVNFDRRAQVYLRYSFQAKVPEYMASGTPVLVYGPSTSIHARHAVRDGWGLTVDQAGKERVKEAITALMEDSGLRAKLGQRARELAFRNHDATVVRQRFRQLMRDVASGAYKDSSVTAA